MKILTYLSIALAIIAILAPFATITIRPDLFVTEMIFGMIYAIVWLFFLGLADLIEKREYRLNKEENRNGCK